MGGKRRLGGLIMVFGAALLVAAAGLAIYNVWDADRAGRASDEVAEELIRTVEEVSDPDLPLTYRDESVPPMPTVEIDGYSYIGLIDIPSLELSLPVMEEWDYDRLLLSPCRFSGSYFTDDLVVCAHNYTRHFGKLRSLAIGADVYFTAVGGAVYRYEVTSVETLLPTAVEEMSVDSKDEWDLTMFTCTLGGQTRVTVRCTRV